MNNGYGNYLNSPPPGVDISKERWEDLSYDAQYYHANKERKEQIRQNNRKTRNEISNKIKKIKSEISCSNCDEDDEAALVFHHTGNKENEISNIQSNGSVGKLYEELKKCIVLCANCHRKLHAGKIDI